MPGYLVPPRAREVLPAGAQATDYERWLAVRREGIGGSDVAAAMGLSPFKSEYALWLDKTGRLREEPDTYLMERGRRLEPAAVQWFCDRAGLSCLRTGTWVRHGLEWMRGNPDRLTSDGGGLECKVVGEDWGSFWKDGPALHAVLQCLWCMLVLDAPHWYLAAMMPDRFAVWLFRRDEISRDLMARLLHTVGGWWSDHILDRDNPPIIDGSKATEAAIKAAYPEPRAPEAWSALIPNLTHLMRRRAELKADIRDAERELRRVENEIRAGMGDALTGADADTGKVLLHSPLRARRSADNDLVRDHAPDLMKTIRYRELRAA